jgi:hypothetical protein
MKNFAALILFLSFCYPAFAQKKEAADTTKKKDQNTTIKKDNDAQVVHITPGASGVKRSIGYKFSTIRSEEDPGNGIFRYNSNNVSDITKLYVDNIDISGEDQTKWYKTWNDTTGATARGAITIADNEGNVITVFNFTGVFIDVTGFWILPVEYVSGTLPQDGLLYYYIFDRITHKKETGSTNLPAPVIPVNPVLPAITVAADTVIVPVVPVAEVVPVISVTEVVPVIPVTEVVPVNPVVPVTTVTEVVVNPVVPAITIAADTIIAPVVPVAEVVPVISITEVVPVIPVTEVVPVNPVVPVTPVTEVVVNPVVPAITVAADTIIVPVVPVAEVVPVISVTEVVPVNPVTEVVPVNPVVPVTSVTEVVQVNPVVPVTAVTEVVPAKPAIPSRQRRIADTERADTIANQDIQVITSEGTRPLVPVRREAVDNPAKKVVSENPVSQPKPASPVSQAKPAIPVSQPKPTNQVSQTFPAAQPKPTNPVNQTYPSNQESQNYPAPETNRLPSYQRYTGTSGGIHGKWYRGIIEVGYGLGVSDYGLNNFRFNFINGFKIGNSSLGLGIGYRRYFTENNIAPFLVSKKSEVPVFLDFRTHFSERKVTPYFAIGAGGTASADTTISGKDRLFFTTSGGIWFNMSDSFAVFAGIAYELQKLEFSDTNPYTGNYRKNSNSISLNIGIAF